MEKYIYLDNAATTKPDKNASEEAFNFYNENFFNPSASYENALKVKTKVNECRKQLANVLNVASDEIYFTSCATESNNTVFECGVKNKKGNIVVSSMEHASVYESAMRLKNKGMDVRFAPVTKDGIVDIEKFEKLIDENTTLVSIIHASNETGSINDIKRLCNIVKNKAPRALFHSDGVQAFCKINVDLRDLGVDFYSISAHKIGGFKGTGLLYIKKGINIPALICGGGQEKGLRSGTENVLGIVDFSQSVLNFIYKTSNVNMCKYRKIFTDKFNLDWVKINSLNAPNTNFIVSLSFKGLKGEILSHVLEDKGLIVGLGSACSTHVRSHRMFDEMGIPKDYSNGSIRLSFSPFDNFEDIVRAADIILEEAIKLRGRING